MIRNPFRSSRFTHSSACSPRVRWLTLLAALLIGCVVSSPCLAKKPGASAETPKAQKEDASGKDKALKPLLPEPAYLAKGPGRPDGQRSLEWIQTTVKLGNRYYGAPYRDLALNHLERSLKTVSDEVERDPFQATEPVSGIRYSLTNLVGRTHPERNARVLLGSHFDTRLWAEKDPDEAKRNLPIDGANDGTSGLAVLLDVLRVLKKVPLQKIGLDIVFFDGEEFGRPRSKDYCQGSRHYVKGPQFQAPKVKPALAIIIDMVGDETLSIRPEASSLQSAPDLMKLIWSTANDLNAKGFRFDRNVHIIDDHSPLQEVGVPAVLLIDFDYPHWHTQRDTVDKLNPQSLEETATVLLAVLRSLDETL